MARPYLLIKQLQYDAFPNGMWSILYLNRIAPSRPHDDEFPQIVPAYRRYWPKIICILIFANG